MKSAIIIYSILFILLASACQKGNTEAVVGGVNATCINNPASCNSSLYQQSNGYTAYGNNSNPFQYHNNSAYLCSCPYGTTPTYNSYAGLGCVQNNYYSYGYYGSFYAYLYIGWGSNSWYQLPQLSSYNYNYNYGNSNCYTGAIQSCVVNENNCPVGYSCRPNSSNSSLGLCATAYR
jgi:hypothetical protein